MVGLPLAAPGFGDGSAGFDSIGLVIGFATGLDAGFSSSPSSEFSAAGF